jgi:hypothetical protein
MHGNKKTVLLQDGLDWGGNYEKVYVNPHLRLLQFVCRPVVRCSVGSIGFAAVVFDLLYASSIVGHCYRIMKKI